MSNYTQTTFFTPKDSLPAGNPAKTIFGAAYDVEFGNISTAIASKFDATSGVALVAGAAFTGQVSDTLVYATTTATFAVYLNSTAPSFGVNTNSGTPNQNIWIDIWGATTFTGQINNDAVSAPKNWIVVTRAVDVLSNIAVGNATDNNTFTFLGTGTVTFNGKGNFLAPAGAVAVEAVGSANQYALQVLANATAGQSLGLLINAGTNASDTAISITNQGATLSLLAISGTGVTIFGNTTNNPTYTFLGTGNGTAGGQWTFNAPAGKSAIIANGVASSFAAVIQGVSTASVSFGLAVEAGTNASDQGFAVLNQPGSLVRFLVRGDGLVTIGNTTDNAGATFLGTGGVTFGGNIAVTGIILGANGTAGAPAFSFSSGTAMGMYRVSANTLGFATSSTLSFQISSTGALSGLGPVAAGLVDMTPDAGTFTITYTGMTAGVTGTATWARIGKLVTLVLPAATGTSNANTFTATGLPSAIQPATLTQSLVAEEASFENSSSVGGIQVAARLTGGSGTIQFAINGATNGWTTTGTKGVALQTTISYLLT